MKLKRGRAFIRTFTRQLCDIIEMEREDLFFWDYSGDAKGYKSAPAHLKGTSAVQFIKTSNITIHTLDDMKRVYLNIFSCKDFDSDVAMLFCAEYFCGRIESQRTVKRK